MFSILSGKTICHFIDNHHQILRCHPPHHKGGREQSGTGTPGRRQAAASEHLACSYALCGSPEQGCGLFLRIMGFRITNMKNLLIYNYSLKCSTHSGTHAVGFCAEVGAI